MEHVCTAGEGETILECEGNARFLSEGVRRPDSGRVNRL